MAGTASPISPSLHSHDASWLNQVEICSISSPARRFGAIRSARCRSSSSESNATRPNGTPTHTLSSGRLRRIPSSPKSRDFVNESLRQDTSGLLRPVNRGGWSPLRPPYTHPAVGACAKRRGQRLAHFVHRQVHDGVPYILDPGQRVRPSSLQIHLQPDSKSGRGNPLPTRNALSRCDGRH